MASINLQTVAARDRLKPRHDPYYAPVRKGCHIGFRKMTPSSVGTWYARCRSDLTGDLSKSSLGTFEALTPSQRYAAALEAAEAFFKQVGMAPLATPNCSTVGQSNCSRQDGVIMRGRG
jgi:hypothetical protein